MVIVKRGCGPGNQTMKTINLAITISTFAAYRLELVGLVERYSAKFVDFVMDADLKKPAVWTLSFEQDMDCAGFLDEFEFQEYGLEVK